ncbi:hypothetical protein [Streptomyces sp. NPDC023588]|uniref:hypothetical protein n=1 Tax=Streptomyces sp. NPDC023588 TaxID=3154907 RepID=UPI0033EFF4A5
MVQDFDGTARVAQTARARVGFDGRAVTARLRPAPGLPWRSTTYGLQRVLGANLVWLGGEGERRRFDLHLSKAPTLGISVAVGRNPHQGRAREVRERWGDLVHAINTASARRMHAVLDTTFGAGPWTDDVWRDAERLAPELHVFTEWAVEAAPSPRRATGRSHRQMIEELVLAPLRSATATPPGTAWTGFAADDSPLDRVRAEAWHNLVEKLHRRAALSW